MPARNYTAFLVHMPDGSTYRAPHFAGALETAEARAAKIIEEIQVSRLSDTGYAYRENAAANWVNWPIYKIEES